MTDAKRALLVASIGILLASGLSGCLRGPGPDEPGEPLAQELIITLVMVEPPASTLGSVLDLSIDHIGLYDANEEEWVALLDQAYEAQIFLEDPLSEPVIAAIVPVLTSTYTILEIVVNEAVLFHPDGATTLDAMQVACYVAVSLPTQPDTVVELELYLAGDVAFEADGDGWRFQPAIMGALTDHGNGDAAFDDPDCRPI